MSPPPAPARWLTAGVLAVSLVALFVFRQRLSQTLNVNWDEFYFLSKVHLAQRHELTGKLLTFHTHLFGWVTRVDANEVRQVLAMREAMLGVSVVGAAAGVFVGWRLLGSISAALFAVFAGGTVSYALNHGAAARFDPLIIALFLVVAALLLVQRRAAAAVAGLLYALALLISIKAVFYAPSLLVLGFCRLREDTSAGRRDAIGEVVAFAAAVVVAGGALFGFHLLTLAPKTASYGVGGNNDLGETFHKVLVGGERFAVPGHVTATLRYDTLFWFLLLLGLCFASARIGARRDGVAGRPAMVRLVGLALPLLSIAVYRNAYAYFYVSVVPAAALLTGVVVVELESFVGRWQRVAATVLIVGLTLLLGRSAVRFAKANGGDQVAQQIDVVDAVHSIFPQPTAYIDRCAMIGSFEKVGPFMSTWTLDDYRKKKQPVFAALIEKHQPQFVLSNIEALNLDPEAALPKRAARLLGDDVKTLREGFIPWWGPIWIAGARVALDPAVAAGATVHVAAGRYVVDTDPAVAVTLDGKAVEAGSTVELAAGDHAVTSTAKTTLTLRTAEAQPPPKRAPPTAKIFRSFTFISP